MSARGCGLCRLLYGVVQASSSITRALFRGYVLVQLLVSGVLLREHLENCEKKITRGAPYKVHVSCVVIRYVKEKAITNGSFVSPLP